MKFPFQTAEVVKRGVIQEDDRIKWEYSCTLCPTAFVPFGRMLEHLRRTHHHYSPFKAVKNAEETY